MEIIQVGRFDLFKKSMTDIESNGVIATLYRDLVLENEIKESYKQFEEKFGFIHGEYEFKGYEFNAMFLANIQPIFNVVDKSLKLKCFVLTQGHDIVVVFEDDEEKDFFYYYVDIEEQLREQYGSK